MPLSTKQPNRSIEEIVRLVGLRAQNLFNTKQLWCSGAVLVVLNRAFNGELTQQQAIKLTAGLGDGIGGGGCLCGGLNGAALAVGLFLGNGNLSAGGDSKVLKATRWLHDQFKLAHGSTCCRVLLKKDKGSSKEKLRACTRRTGSAAELGAELIIDHRPELIKVVDWDYLNRKDGHLQARMRILTDNLNN